MVKKEPTAPTKADSGPNMVAWHVTQNHKSIQFEIHAHIASVCEFISIVPEVEDSPLEETLRNLA